MLPSAHSRIRAVFVECGARANLDGEDIMDRRNLTALLGILAVAGYQNREKIAAALRELTQGGAQPQTAGTEPGGVPSHLLEEAWADFSAALQAVVLVTSSRAAPPAVS
ncbi:hypothetical protein AJ87_16405 [Rhizobium yanglingense]|nr:hypothetical protein AJ87_16405 [Rhizobium yanglingense]